MIPTVKLKHKHRFARIFATAIRVLPVLVQVMIESIFVVFSCEKVFAQSMERTIKVNIDDVCTTTRRTLIETLLV